VTSRDRMGRVEHLARILRSLHFVELGNLPNPRVRVGRVNSIELKLDLMITLNVLQAKQERQIKITNLILIKD